MTDSERTEKRAISMYPSDWHKVDESDEYDAGTSASLRRIVREWYAFRPVIERAKLARHVERLAYDPDAPAPGFRQDAHGVYVVEAEEAT